MLGTVELLEILTVACTRRMEDGFLGARHLRPPPVNTNKRSLSVGFSPSAAEPTRGITLGNRYNKPRASQGSQSFTSECTRQDLSLVFLLPAPSLYSRLLRRNVRKMVARIRAKIWSIGSTGRFSPARHHGSLPSILTKDCTRSSFALLIKYWGTTIIS